MNKRLFVAIDLPELVVKELYKVVCDLVACNVVKASFTAAENLHITLKFLGECSESSLVSITERLSVVNQDHFDIQIGALGTFLRGNDQVAIVFARIISPECIVLAQRINEALFSVVKQEEREFVPHITLARVKRVLNNDKLKNFIGSYPIKMRTFRVRSFALKESILDGSVVQHKVIKCFYF